MGLCPECLLKAGFSTATGTAAADPSDPRPRFVAPPVPEVARLFPQLEILELLGQGGMGAVYKARQKELDRIVALKLLPPNIGQDGSFAERFAREARALAKLNHPGIVQLYEFGRAEGLFYFLMEFVDGASLRQLLNAGRISPREALAIVPQICDALQYAHDQGVVHRDIKPENILVDRRGRVKVADFGVAKLMGAGIEPQTEAAAAPSMLTTASKVIGTPQYMAPEQLEHPGEVDHRADIYALGVVFYQMLTGELPQGQLGRPSQKVRIDVRLDEVLLQALEREPARRYQHISEVKSAVEAITGTPGDPPSDPVPPVRVLRWRDRWMWDTSNLAAMGLAPVIICSIAVLLLVPVWGNKALRLMFLEPVGLPFVAIYALVALRLRRLKAIHHRPDADIAEALVVRRPLQAPGLAILSAQQLELIPIKGAAITVPLADIAAISEIRWLNGTRLWAKRGLALELKDGQRLSFAIPAPFARDWRARLSRGALASEP